MGEAVPPLPNTPSWRGAQGEHRDKFTFLPFTYDTSDADRNENGTTFSLDSDTTFNRNPWRHVPQLNFISSWKGTWRSSEFPSYL
jgi:hypothetical protein